MPGGRLAERDQHLAEDGVACPAYEAAWAHITARSPSFLDYLDKTDRRLPVLRLVPVAG
jgi:hypothetical protein